MIHFSPLFQNNFPNNAQTKIYPTDLDSPRQIYSSSEVSDPSEVPRIDGKLMFSSVKEVKLICVRSMICIVLARTIDNLVRAEFFSKKYSTD